MNRKPMKHMRLLIPFVIMVITLLAGCSKQEAEKPQDKKPSEQNNSISKTADPVKESREMVPATPSTSSAGAGEMERPMPGSGNNNPSLRPPLIGTGRIFPEAVVPEVAKKVEAILVKEFGGLRNGDPSLSTIFSKLWKRTWPDTFNAPLLSSSRDALIAAGEMLPTELANFRITSENFIGELQKGQTDMLKDDTEIEAAFLMLTLSLGDVHSGGGNLISVLADRADQLPPSKGDVILFNIVFQALKDLKQGGATAVSFDDLKPLAEGKNPVIRLLALQASHKAVTEKTRYASSENSQIELETAEIKTAFYKHYLEERDPQIVKEALWAMGTVPSHDALKLLLDFRKARAGQTELVAVVDDAIHACEAMLNSFGLAK